MDKMSHGESVTINSLDELPEEAGIDRRTFERVGEYPNLSVPLTAGGVVVGALGLNVPNVNWDEELVGRLKLVGEIVGAALLRRRKEEELSTSEARFKAFADQNPAILYIKESTGKHVYGNSTVLKRFGITLEQFVGTTIHDFFAKDVSEKVEAADRQVLTTRKVLELPEYSHQFEGRERWWKDFKFPIPLSGGRTLLGGIALDVTSRKTAELELQKAYDEIRVLKDRLERENVYLREEVRSSSHYEEIVGESQPLQKTLHKVEQVAGTDSTVLILGETGTGKELIARAIHRRSSRKRRPLIKVNCAALPATLVESELFGHEKGAFTGAANLKQGRFELADGGTIFFDEIGELDEELQTKLLRVLQEGELERLGGTKTLKVDVRVLAATNRDLQKAREEGSFRSDLFYRLNVFPIEVPPLRERREDIPVLIWYFVNLHAAALGKVIDKIPQSLMDAFVHYDWPGNVRELENLIERSVILSPGHTLQIDEPIGTGALRKATDQKETTEARSETTGDVLPRSLEEMDRSEVLKLLEDCGWKVAGRGGAAAILGVKESTFRYRMKKLGIRRPSATSPPTL
jgi:PAS domain S-box-containing protein